MTVPSLEKVARKIFGAEDPESVERWVRYWDESEKRNARLLEPLQRKTGMKWKISYLMHHRRSSS
jgi:hypothetical protein